MLARAMQLVLIFVSLLTIAATINEADRRFHDRSAVLEASAPKT